MHKQTTVKINKLLMVNKTKTAVDKHKQTAEYKYKQTD